MSIALTELNSGIESLLESPAIGDVAALISKNTARSIAQFGRYERQTLVKLRGIYEEGWRRMQTTITLRGVSRRAGVPLSVDETVRLSMLKRQLEEEMRAMEGKLRELVPGSVGEAGRMGELAGAGELDILLKEIPRIGFPRFAIINREAVEFYSNYALTTSIDYGQEALAAIKRRLDMALVTGEAYGPVVRDVRKLMLEKRGMAMTGLNYKANRVVRTEMVRAYAGGHTSYGRSCDFVIGEKQYIQMGACDVCEPLEGKEYIFADGESFEILHPYCHCGATYLFSKNLFTGEELERLVPEPVPGKFPITGRPYEKKAVLEALDRLSPQVRQALKIKQVGFVQTSSIASEIGGTYYVKAQKILFFRDWCKVKYASGRHLVFHEMGHASYQQIPSETRRAVSKMYIKFRSKQAKLVTKYAGKNVAEFWAENFGYYYVRPERLKTVNPEMYEIIKSI